MTGYALCALAVVLVLGWAYLKGRAEWEEALIRERVRRIAEMIPRLRDSLRRMDQAARAARIELEHLTATMEDTREPRPT